MFRYFGVTAMTALVGMVFCIAMGLGELCAQTAEADIAGLRPDRRPASAPVISAYPKNDEWYVHALRGVVPPQPENLNFLDDQGRWYTPFTNPGMTRPYDLRGWHSRE